MVGTKPWLSVRWSILLITFIAAIIFSSQVLALDKLTGYVNDEAGVITPEYRASLEKELISIRNDTSVEMAVATVKSLGGIPIEEYSLNLSHGTLGEKGKDNGILLFLAVDDREYRIEVGYGLEPVINAALAGRIGRAVMAPQFKAGNYGQGMLDAATVIGSILRNDTSPETQALISSNQVNVGPLVPIIILIVFIILFSVIISFARVADSKKKSSDNNDFTAAAIIAAIFSGRGGGGLGGGGFGGGGSSGGFGGFGGGSFGGGGFSGKF